MLSLKIFLAEIQHDEPLEKIICVQELYGTKKFVLLHPQTTEVGGRFRGAFARSSLKV